jgi:hypothetical protein
MGLWGLCTRGLPLRIVMIGTLTGAQWGIYDFFFLHLLRLIYALLCFAMFLVFSNMLE